MISDNIKNQKRFIPWFHEGDKKIPAVPWQDFNNRKKFEDIQGNVGIVFDKSIDLLVGLDLDNCIDNGTYNAIALKAIELFKHKAYIEISVSGRGLHFIFYADIGVSFNAKPIEYYEQGRYFTISGNVVQESTSDPQVCQTEIKQFLKEFCPEKLRVAESNAIVNSDPSFAPLPKIQAALNLLNPDCNRGDWLKIACALHNEFEGLEQGFDLFHEWSSKATVNYKGKQDCRLVWESLGKYTGLQVTIATLFKMANEVKLQLPGNIEVHLPAEFKKRWFTLNDLQNKLGPIDWMVQDFFEEHTLSIIWGDTQAFKSFIALELCYCIAAGLEWHGKSVNQGPVLYVCGEGSNGIARRIAGLRQKYQVKEDFPLYVSDGSRNILDPKEIENILEYGKSLPQFPKYIVFDTLNRNFTGDENSSKEVALALGNLEKITKTFNCSVSLVHHGGKDGTRIRGSSAWQNGVDCQYEVKRNGETLETTLIGFKMKDAMLPESLNLQMKIVDIAENITTLITEQIEYLTVSEENKAKMSVRNLLLQLFEKEKQDLLLTVIYERLVTNGASEGAIRKELNSLVNQGLIQKKGKGLYGI